MYDHAGRLEEYKELYYTRCQLHTQCNGYLSPIVKYICGEIFKRVESKNTKAVAHIPKCYKSNYHCLNDSGDKMACYTVHAYEESHLIGDITIVPAFFDEAETEKYIDAIVNEVLLNFDNRIKDEEKELKIERDLETLRRLRQEYPYA